MRRRMRGIGLKLQGAVDAESLRRGMRTYVDRHADELTDDRARQVHDWEAIVSEPFSAYDKVALERWARAVLSLGVAANRAGRFDEAAERLAALEPMLPRFKSARLLQIWIQAQLARSGALMGLERYNAALETVDRVLALHLRYRVNSRQSTGAELVVTVDHELRSLLVPGPGADSLASPTRELMVRLGQSAVQGRILALEALQRYDESYAAAVQLLESARFTADSELADKARLQEQRIVRKRDRWRATPAP